MIMSQQSTPLATSSFGVDLRERFATATKMVVGAIQASRQARAGRFLRSTIADRYSDEDLAGYGWSANDIRRLKSK
jgi:hypothetical protein